MRFRSLLLLSTALPVIAVATAHAGPQGGTVVGGTATIQGQGSANVTVNQFSQNAVINWNTFNIGAGERTQFVQPNATSVILNRVTGGQGPSQILGTIDANGRVMLVNRDGIIFGAGAVINTAGFLATTADIKNDDFMAGKYNFAIPGKPDASIVNEGRITAASGGFAALVAPGVRNSGTITANLGTVVLGAGNTFTANLDFYGDRLITLGVGDAIAAQVKDVATGQPLKALITNDGKLKANGGRVELTAAAARTVVDAVINTSGVVEANSVGMRNGQIVLSAATAGTKGAGAPTQTVRVSGKLSAAGHKAGTKGGKIIVTGENIEVANATINASGRDGGGTVMIGGDWGGGKPNTALVSNQSAVLDGNAIPTASTVSIDANSRIDASARERGDGGKVIVWSDVKTSFAGTILALGGTAFGNGGFIETSGKTVEVSGTINAGRGGTWLLDPDDLTINSGLAATIMATLNGGTNVTQQTTSSGTGGNGDIFVTAQIVWNSSATLTLSAYRNIIINDTGVAGTIKNTGGGNLILRANSEGAFAVGSADGIVSLPAGTFANRVDWSASTGSVSVYYNPTSYASPTDFTTGNGHITVATPSQLTAYMLVNSVADLNAIGTSTTTLGGTYALSRNINASGPAFTPIGSGVGAFTGRFDGNGGLGTNYTISNLNIAPTSGSIFNIGLFGITAIGSEIRNLNLSNVTVAANPNITSGVQYVGTVVGQNAGTLTNVHVNSGSVNGTTANWTIAGGLVGLVSGTISNSSANVDVTVGNSTVGGNLNLAGGLAGRSDRGTISNSSAAGAITGGTNTYVGGLVGQNLYNSGAATISGSTATGNVTVAAGGNAGGLVGQNSAGSTITNSTAHGTVTATGANARIGGLVGWNLGAISGSQASGNLVAGAFNGIMAGGLVGQNDAGATIASSTASGNVTVGDSTTSSQENNVGGLAGVNRGAVTGSSASGVVLAGAHSNIGGLVGRNETGATIASSSASGIVTANVSTGDQNTVGGLVGFNFGTISGSSATGQVVGASNGTNSAQIGGLVGLNDAAGTIDNSFATGNVVGGNNASAGGFVGFNQGTITNSHATGAVSSLNNFAGGFVGGNQGLIDNSYATGLVTGGGFGTGGFAGFNGVDSASGRVGRITNSHASGNVVDFSTGNTGASGGFVGANQDTAKISDSQATGNVTGASTTSGGFAGTNEGTISSSSASGNVVIGGTGAAGGFVGENQGDITNATASGVVGGVGSTFLGGFAGGNFGTISSSSATGAVAALGPNSSVGGFAGLNYGLISGSTSSGAVVGTSNSYLGGLVGLNFGLIQNAPSSSSVAGSGDSNVAGGLVGFNFGIVDPSNPTGNVTTGANSIAGGVVGANGALLFPDGTQQVGVLNQPASPNPGTVTAGPGSTTGAQVGQQYPVGGVPQPPASPCNAGFFCGTLFNPNPNGNPDQGQPVVSPLLNIAEAMLIDLLQDKKQDQVIDTTGNTSTASGGAAGPGGNSKGGNQGRGHNGGRPAIHTVPPIGLGPLPSGMPPIGETRFLQNEVVMQLGVNLTPEQVAALATKYGLEVISTQSFSLLGRTVYRFRITGGLSVRGAIAALQSGGATISAQPSYAFTLAQDGAAPAATTSQGTPAPAAPAQNQGDSAQYVVAKLGLLEAHGVATGKGVKIAVIDSEIDAQHPDLRGAVAGSYDALPSSDQTPHSHGTGMAGAIGSHQRLLGIAPSARILGIRAFGVSNEGAQGTSMNIVKGLEWAVQQGAQIINMSFAGPRDPILEQALKALKDKGVVLIGAAGNAGPKSPPLFPGADKNVIGVSATDQDDRTFKGANRGAQVAIAAPGVDILVPAPEGGYQLTTGTSVAAAEISGVVALMLERNPRLSPDEVRAILTATARKLPQGRAEVGAGLVDPVQALVKSAPKQASAQ